MQSLRLVLTQFLFFVFLGAVFFVSSCSVSCRNRQNEKTREKVDSNRGAQHRVARSADLLQDVLLVLREAQGPPSSSENPV